MSSTIGLLVGLVLLLWGRRLYWVLVAGIGFVSGVVLAPLLIPGAPDWLILAVAFVLALLGAGLAVVAQTFIVALVGFFGGGAIGVLLLRPLGLEGALLTWVVYLGAGIVGIIVALALFEWGLILLSSLAGAIMIVRGPEHLLAIPPGIALPLDAVLAVMGMVVQARLLRAPPQRVRPALRS